MPTQVTFPVRILRDHVTALEAALSVCLADPNLRAVHRLRTGTRRLEAQLLLLDLIPSVPEHRAASTALRRELRRLRRAAGEVRDLDVHGRHLHLLDTAAPPPQQSPAAATAQAVEPESAETPAPAEPAASSRPLANLTSSDSAASETAVRHGSAKLAERLSRKRARAATDLQQLLGHRQGKAALTAEALLRSLRPAGGLQLSAEDLLRATQTVLYRDGLLHGPATGKLDEEELHAVRKSAKLARYLAQTMPSNSVMETAAARFEALQEAGGLWHDALELARAARRYLGRHHPLSLAFAADRRRHLAAYRAALHDIPAPQPIAEPASEAKAASRRTGRKPGQPAAKSAASRDAGSRAAKPARNAKRTPATTRPVKAAPRRPVRAAPTP